jgi:putative sensory transduction regulator
MTKRIMWALWLCLLVCAPGLGTAAGTDLSKIKVSDDDKTATSQLLGWLNARGFDASMVNGVLVYRTKGIPLNLTALQGTGELDRIVFLSFYSPKEEFKGKPEFVELARKLNNAQNFMQVKVDDDGDLSVTASLTYVDELSAREFDYFVDLFTAVVRQYILTDEAVKMLQ